MEHKPSELFGKDMTSAFFVGQTIVDQLLKQNEIRSHEIIAGIDGERFHTKDVHRLVMLLSDGQASEALQIAAVGHDAERFSVLGAGGGYRGVRNGSEYEAYKKAHAVKGADIIVHKLGESGVDSKIIDRVSFLIAHHDDSAKEIAALHDPELEMLVAADSLSWLNFSAPNYFNGKEPQGIPGLQDKMSFMLKKLPHKFWSYLPRIQLDEPRVLPYLQELTQKVATERGIPVPSYVS